MVTARAPESAFASYTSAAFWLQYNVILLGGAALLSLAAATLAPLALGLGAEVLWLVVGPRLPAFRRWVDGRAGAKPGAVIQEEVTTAMPSLGPAYAERLTALDGALAEVKRSVRGPAQPEHQAALGDFGAVRPAFLRLCELHQRLARFLSTTEHGELERELSRLDQAFTTEKDLGVRFTLRQAIVLTRRRIEERERLVGTRRAVELKLEMIERSLAHLRSQRNAEVGASELAAEIRGLMTQVASAAALEAESSQAFSAASNAPPAG